jgi:adenine-specific DNA methylase
MSRPKLLIEQWLPIEAIGAECIREKSLGLNTFPPPHRLHVWWARRPLLVSRAAILASLLPAYPTEADPDARPWPDRLLAQFPTFESYKSWFLRVIGILGDPVAGKKVLALARASGRNVPNPYTYSRAFTYNASEEQTEQLSDFLQWAWGTPGIKFCDPMAGGGSIPFEALRYGLDVHANEFNPVASLILKATLEYPVVFGHTLIEDMKVFGDIWSHKVQARLRPFFSQLDESAVGACYLWARTVVCPETGKPVPLATSWWLRKGSDPLALKLSAGPKDKYCKFEVVHGEAARNANPDKATVKRGTAISPWCGAVIDNTYIKSEANAGRMGQQLIAVATKTIGKMSFREARPEDIQVYESAVSYLSQHLAAWDCQGLSPTVPLPMNAESWTHGNTPAQYDAKTFADLFSPRQLMANLVILEELQRLFELVKDERGLERAKAILVLFVLVVGKVVNYNTRQCFWDYTRQKIAHGFSRHDFAFRWCSTEFDASKNLLPWAIKQVCDAYADLTKLALHSNAMSIDVRTSDPVRRLQVTQGASQDLPIEDGSLVSITVDPPYYDNVNYAELSDFFFVWYKPLLKGYFDELLCSGSLTPKDEEAVANSARFAPSPKRKLLAKQDYERKMLACFMEMNRVLKADGVLTVMFTHKQVQAWDTLGSSLMRAGFRIDASWPVHTESEVSLHQAKKNAAASTILLVCRKREATSE